MSDNHEDNPASNEAADNVNESLDINNELENAANGDVSNGQGSTNRDQETQSETQENERPSPPDAAVLKNKFVSFAKFGDKTADGSTIKLTQSDKWFKQAGVIGSGKTGRGEKY